MILYGLIKSSFYRICVEISIRVHTDMVKLHISDKYVGRWIEIETAREFQLTGLTQRNHIPD